MFLRTIKKSLLLLTFPWLFLKTCEAVHMVDSTQESKGKQISTQPVKEKSIPAPGAGTIFFEEIAGMETDSTVFLKQQAGHQLEDIQNHYGISSCVYPVRLKDLYFLLVYEYRQLPEKKTDIDTQRKYQAQIVEFYEQAKARGCILSTFFAAPENNKKEALAVDVARIMALERARTMMSYPTNDGKTSLLSYCFYGYFLAYKLYQAGPNRDLVEAKRVLEDTMGKLYRYDSQESATWHYVEKWIGRCLLLGDRIYIESEFLNWRKNAGKM